MRHKIVFVIIIIFFSYIIPGSVADEQPKRVMNFLAVMDLKCGKEIDKQQCSALTDIVIDELVKIKKYTVIDRANRDKILAEAGFQQTACVDERCTIEMGRQLGVGKIVVGSITMLGQTYLISLQLLNVETAAIETSAREKCEKCELDNLIDAIGNAAKKLMGEEAVYTPGSSQPPISSNIIKSGDMVQVSAGEFLMGCNDSIAISYGQAQEPNPQYQNCLKGAQIAAMTMGQDMSSMCASFPKQISVQGNLNKCEDSEKPFHTVYLDTYLIDINEVTVEKYQACVQAGKCTPPGTGQYCNGGMEDKKNHPVNCVDWNQAKAYCEWSGKRLPTEAEWEKAARGTDGRVFPWGNTIGVAGNFCDSYCPLYNKDNTQNDGYPTTSPVGSFGTPSIYGVLDMAGNVLEWTADWYDPNYYSNGINRNPPGPVSGQYRVIRGGSWGDKLENLRTTFRGNADPSKQRDLFGFRCAKTQ